MFRDLGATVSKYYNFLTINLCITDKLQVIKAKFVLLLVVDRSEKRTPCCTLITMLHTLILIILIN